MALSDIDLWLFDEMSRDIHEIWDNTDRKLPASLQEFMTQTVELLLAQGGSV